MERSAEALTLSRADYSSSFIPLKERVGYFLILSTLCGVLYFFPQWFPLREPVELAITSLDLAIVFNPAWSWVYQTVYLVTPLVALSLSDRDTFMSHFRGYLSMALFCAICFSLFPVEFSRRTLEVEQVQDAMYRVILQYDGPINTMPSLHVALALYSWLYFAFTVKAFSWPKIPSHVLAATWFLLLCYSSVALKQHYVVDVPAGIVTALVAYGLSRKSKIRASESVRE